MLDNETQQPIDNSYCSNWKTGNKCPVCGGNELNWGGIAEYFCDTCDYFNNCPSFID